MEANQKVFIGEIFLWRARLLLGILLNNICIKADISQSMLGKQAKEYRKYLKEKGYLYKKRDTGTVDQSGISRAISAERLPGYAQIFIWLHVLRSHFESKEYHNKCLEENKDIFVLTKEIEADVYRLALCGTPEEIIEAYKKHQYLINEDSPEFITAYKRHLKLLEEGKNTNF